MIIANSTGYELAPAGTHNVVCVDVIDCGEAYGIEPDPVTGMRLVPGATEDRKPQAKIRFVFESEKKMADGRPFQIDRMFGATLSDQGHLKPFLDAWGIELEMTPQGPDMAKSVIGKTALVNIIHRDDKWANISSIMPGQVELSPSGDYDGAGTRERMKAAYAKRQNENAPY